MFLYSFARILRGVIWRVGEKVEGFTYILGFILDLKRGPGQNAENVVRREIFCSRLGLSFRFNLGITEES